jgi:dihydroxyacetone kinase
VRITGENGRPPVIAGAATQKGVSTKIAIAIAIAIASERSHASDLCHLPSTGAHRSDLPLPESELGCFHHTESSYLC